MTDRQRKRRKDLKETKVFQLLYRQPVRQTERQTDRQTEKENKRFKIEVFQLLDDPRATRKTTNRNVVLLFSSGLALRQTIKRQRQGHNGC